MQAYCWMCKQLYDQTLKAVIVTKKILQVWARFMLFAILVKFRLSAQYFRLSTGFFGCIRQQDNH